MTVWTPEILAQAKRMREEGATYISISRDLGISDTAVRKALQRREEPKPRCEPTWTPERDERLKALYLADELSMTQIAGILDPSGKMTRNAVSGRLSRLGLARTKRQFDEQQRIAAGLERAKKKLEAIARKHAAPHPWENPTGKLRPPSEVSLTVVPEVQPLNLRIFDPGFGGCRWPTGGEGEETTFCCLPRPDGKAYCGVHHKLSISSAACTKRRRLKWAA